MVNDKSKFRLKWRNAINVLETFFTVAELWPTKEKKLFNKIVSYVYSLVCILFNIIIFDEMTMSILRKDYGQLSTHLVTFGLYIVYTIKIIVFQFRKRLPLKSILNSIEQPLFEAYPAKILEKYKEKCVKFTNRVSIFYMICVATSILTYLNQPFYTDSSLPIQSSHQMNSFQFYTVLFIQCFACFYIVMTGIAFDLLIISLISIGTAQLEILCKVIKTFRAKKKAENERDFFKKCLVQHRAIIKFIQEIEEVFNSIFLIQSVGSVMSICNGLFQLVHTDKLFSFQFYFNLSYTFNVLFETGICCWFGTILMLKSAKVADACYNYDWLNSSTSTKQDLIFMILRSQTSLYISAGKYVQLSMSMYLSVLKAAYSYFALMQSLYNKNSH